MYRRLLLLVVVAIALCAVFGSSVITAPKAHAASCAFTYWTNDQTGYTAGSVSGVYFDILLFELRDDYTGAYCGNVETQSCVTIPYSGLDALKTYRLESFTYLNSHYVSMYQTVIDRFYDPAYNCAPRTPAYGLARGGQVLVQAKLYGSGGDNYGQPFMTFYAG
jgi:hypothetical protein